MKTQHIVLSLLFVVFASFSVNAQKKTDPLVKKETFKVWGECGMCKKTIEKAAKDSGATAASWDVDSKKLTVSYSTAKSSNEKIQQAIAAAGYDTRDLTADDAAYDKLHECCKYDRKAAAAKAAEKEAQKESNHHH
ncbi:heavy-metal-associated domain-containing protein [Paraflavitalea sp. CAU 1676]|uniref:heavy-metal-associated domain-containing protein n=1 Tax=Paraflavitalea sp. CAU 1676 TaxID=3032598 RepID=UPI0023DAB217|nr:heavy-metal-associated domain-containing protein [Paraflavitalea sp. CAU 1676]MDF2190270.1 heavy-metal-associated domain-containing protein [Paraflavitalea sp. CAU 1676]